MSAIAKEREGDTVPPAAESRAARRRRLAAALAASFSGTPLTVIDVSVTGLMATHADRLMLGKQGTATIGANSGRRYTLTLRVVWSRLIQANNVLSYVSGFAVSSEHRPLAEELVAELVSSGAAHDDEESLRRKADARKQRQGEVTPSVRAGSSDAAAGGAYGLDLASRALHHLRARPQLFDEWRSRVRPNPRYSVDTLAVWEYLGRGVDIALVQLAVELE